MIIGNTRTAEEEIITALQESTHHFHLTGSRFFGGYNERSDWDFFVQADSDSDVYCFLRNLGFELENFAYPDDAEIIDVYRHPTARVDVQIVKNTKSKALIQNALRESGLGVFKDISDKLWAFGYEVFKQTVKKALGCESIAPPK